MKIRTDFVTNSSSSSFVTITITKKDGAVLEQEYPMDDTGFGESLYTLEKEELLKLVSGHATVTELLNKLDDLYDGMLLDEDEENTFEGVTFEEILDITITDLWNCDGEEGGMVVITGYPKHNIWTVSHAEAELDEDDFDEDEYDDEEDEFDDEYEDEE